MHCDKFVESNDDAYFNVKMNQLCPVVYIQLRERISLLVENGELHHQISIIGAFQKFILYVR